MINDIDDYRVMTGGLADSRFVITAVAFTHSI